MGTSWILLEIDYERVTERSMSGHSREGNLETTFCFKLRILYFPNIYKERTYLVT